MSAIPSARRLGLLVPLAACFSGDVTIGAICVEAGDCGPAQQCRHELCGRCGNGRHESGELCYGDPVAIDGVADVVQFRIADLDDDGRDEIIVRDGAGALLQLTPDADGFAVAALTVPAAVLAFALGDADGDGDGDIVAASAATVAVLTNDGAAGFTSSLELAVDHTITEATVVPAAEATATLAFVDDAGALHVLPLVDGATARRLDVGSAVHVGPAVYFDGDEIVDFAVVDEQQDRLAVIHGQEFGALTRIDVGRGPVAVVGYDRERDGRTDFMTIDRLGRTVTLVTSPEPGELQRLDALAFDTAPLGATAFDADVDGFSDVFVTHDAAIEFWRGELGRYPEGARFADTGASAVGVGRFGPVPLLELLTLRAGTLRRQEATP